MQKLLSWVLIIVLVILCVSQSVSAGKNKLKGGRNNNRAVDEGCSEWTYGPCVVKDNKICGKGVKQGARTGDTCLMKEKSFPCKVKCDAVTTCQYKPVRQASRGVQCDPTTGKMTVTRPLIRGDPATCPATKVVQKNCEGRGRIGRPRSVREAKSVGGRQRSNRPTAETVSTVAPTAAGGRRQKPKCKYTKAPWAPCNPDTNQRTKTMTLKAGSDPSCQASKTTTKPCPRANVGGRRRTPRPARKL